MPISPLPTATVRLLGSPLAIATPLSVVKELVENAIDAEATSVEVVISPNTVDSVEVRDNGRGINQNDFDALGRRGHTSKLTTFDELKIVGGRSLGFRGEALASANDLAKVTITTRTSGETVATRLHLSDTGGVAKQEQASAPVGTAVKVSGLFSKLPVRRQTAIKEASKTIPKIKELLQSYALARLDIRYLFKVLGRPKLSWSYTPGKVATVREAVLRVYGHDLASQCVEVTVPEAEGIQNATMTAGSSSPSAIRQYTTEYVIKAFLPRHEANLKLISKRAFISVDSRPVSPFRGAGKKLISMFRTHFNERSISTNPNRHLKDPFIRIDIQCSPGSYDPNVEPSKDNVLFVDEHLLLDRFEALLRCAYPPFRRSVDPSRDEDGPDDLVEEGPETDTISTCEAGTTSTVLGSSLGTVDCPRKQNALTLQASEEYIQLDRPVSLTEQAQINLQLARELGSATNQGSPISTASDPSHQRGIARPDQQHSLVAEPVAEQGVASSVQRWKVDMSADPDCLTSDEEDIPVTTIFGRPGLRGPSETHLEEPQENAINDINPWVIAKMTASRGQNVAESPVSSRKRAPIHDEDLEPDREHDHPILRVPGSAPGDLELPPRQQMSCPEPNTTSRPLNSFKPVNPYRSPVSSSPTTKTPLEHSPLNQGNTEIRMASSMFQSPPPSLNSRGSRQKPFKTYSRVHRLSEDGHEMTGEAPTRVDNRRERRKAARRTTRDNATEGNTEHDLGELKASCHTTAKNHKRGSVDIGNALGFQRDSSDLIGPTGGHPGEHPKPSLEPSRIRLPEISPIKDKQPPETGLPAGDQRGYLMRTARSLPAVTPRKLRRINSDLLPLETSNLETLTLTQSLRTDAPKVYRMLNMTACYDTYVNCGRLEAGLDMTMGSEDVTELETRLKCILSSWTAGERTDAHIELNLLSGFKGKSKQV